MDRTRLTALLELDANYTGIVEACHYVKELLPLTQHPKGLIPNAQGNVWFELSSVKYLIEQDEDKLTNLRRSEHTPDNQQAVIETTLAIACNHGWQTVMTYMLHKMRPFTAKKRTLYEELKFLDEVHKELDAEIQQYKNKSAEVAKEREKLSQ